MGIVFALVLESWKTKFGHGRASLPDKQITRWIFLEFAFFVNQGESKLPNESEKNRKLYLKNHKNNLKKSGWYFVRIAMTHIDAKVRFPTLENQSTKVKKLNIVCR